MSALEDKLRDLGIGVGWNHPFFLPALSRLMIKEDKGVPTMAVQMNGKVRVNPDFAARLGDQELAGVLFHEIMHLMMNHAFRQEGRNIMVDTSMGRVSLFNIAADMAINNVLREMGVKLPEGAVYAPPDMATMNAEQIYEVLAKEPQRAPQMMRGTRGQKGEDGEGQPMPTAGCGVAPGEDDGGGKGESEGGDGQGKGAGGEPQSNEDWEREWEKVAVQARNISAGTAAGTALARLFERRQAMRWKQLLKSTVARAIAQHGRDEQSMTKRNRRSPARVIYPGWMSRKVSVGVIVDSSGSVSDEQLTQCIDEITEIAKVGEARLYLVVHDAVVQFSGWIDGTSRNRVAQCMRGRGGTEFTPAYEAMEKAGRRFDAVIHLTDGYPCEDWPKPPRNGRRFIVGLVADCQGGWPNEAVIVKVKV